VCHWDEMLQLGFYSASQCIGKHYSNPMEEVKYRASTVGVFL
jgi:hypothetical protein